MNLASLKFFACFIGSLGLYYVLPKKLRNAALLVFSAVFFFAASEWYTFLYLLVGVMAAFLAAEGISHSKRPGRWLVMGLAVNLGILTLLKYTRFFAQTAEGIARIFGQTVSVPSLSLKAPTGVSFYTLSVAAYLIDVYWQTTEPWSGSIAVSGGRTFLASAFWPVMTSGPIVRKKDIEEDILRSRSFNWQQITFGLQRMLWGIFKKLVISARIGVLVDAVYGDMEQYQGCYVVLAALLFMMQLYTDFSGCMDIIIGAAQCYGIRLPENFRNPFFAVTVQEYWQRWHITLGLFLKDYVMYPLLRSGMIRRFTKWTKKHLGKNASKTLPTYLAMLVVWLANGLWHGGDWKYVCGEGLWFWFAIILEQNVTKAVKKHFHTGKAAGEGKTAGAASSDAAGESGAGQRISPAKVLGRVLSFLWVYLAVCFGNLFFRLDSLSQVGTALKSMFSVWNPGILTDGSLYQLGLSRPNVLIIPILLVLLFVVDLLNEKKDVRERLAGGNMVIRWGVFLLLIWGITVFGMYGPGYDAASFIYGNF